MSLCPGNDNDDSNSESNEGLVASDYESDAKSNEGLVASESDAKSNAVYYDFDLKRFRFRNPFYDAVDHIVQNGAYFSQVAAPDYGHDEAAPDYGHDEAASDSDSDEAASDSDSDEAASDSDSDDDSDCFHYKDPIYDAVAGNDPRALNKALAQAKEDGTLDLNTVEQSDGVHPPLHLAFRSGHVHCIKPLLEHGADPFLKDCFDSLPINYACTNGNWDALKYFITECNQDPKGLAHMLNTLTEEGKMPLHHAAEADELEMIQLMLKHGARAFSPIFNGVLPSHLCVSEEARNLLLRHEAEEKKLIQNRKRKRAGK